MSAWTFYTVTCPILETLIHVYLFLSSLSLFRILSVEQYHPSRTLPAELRQLWCCSGWEMRQIPSYYDSSILNYDGDSRRHSFSGRVTCKQTPKGARGMSSLLAASSCRLTDQLTNWQTAHQLRSNQTISRTFSAARFAMFRFCKVTCAMKTSLLIPRTVVVLLVMGLNWFYDKRGDSVLKASFYGAFDLGFIRGTVCAIDLHAKCRRRNYGDTHRFQL